MIYQDTGGEAPDLDFQDVLLTGLGRDGGLYVPRVLPELDMSGLDALDYPALAARVLAGFTQGSPSEDELLDMTRGAYGGFAHAAVAPLKQIGPNDWLMELFHGPTLAFKDFALQVLGRLFDHALRAQDVASQSWARRRATLARQPSKGCRGREAVDIFILYPKGRVRRTAQANDHG